jgi:hypothetical protein
MVSSSITTQSRHIHTAPETIYIHLASKATMAKAPV